MAGNLTIPLTLPQWDGGSRKIRFIHLVDQTSFRLTDCPNKVSVNITAGAKGCVFVLRALMTVVDL